MSKRVFEWQDYSSWKKEVENIYSAFLTPAFIKKVKSNRGLIEYERDFLTFCLLSGYSEEDLLPSQDFLNW